MKRLRNFINEIKKDNTLRVKKSYYTFSKEYPAGNIPIKRRKNRRLRQGPARIILMGLLAAVLVCSSFLAVSLLLEISSKQPAVQEAPITATGENLLMTQGVQALYMPREKIGDTVYIKGFIRELRKKNCNSVVIDFKTPEGKLSYSSLNEYAIKGQCSLYDNDTVRRCINLFKENNISVIARVYCFEDNTVASTSSELAIKYMDTDVNWLDGSDENGGKAWLNPCLGRTRNYLVSILKELYALDIRGFLLESCSLPDTDNTATATYPGLKHNTKNEALRAFLTKARKALPEDAFILMGYTAETALNGNSELFDGLFADADYDGYAADLSVRDPAYTIDKKSKFSSMLSLFTLIENSNPDKKFIPVISVEEYSYKYISTLKKSGYTNYIIFAANGEY